MQAYLEPEQAFSITMPQPVFEISIAYKKKHVCSVFANFKNIWAILGNLSRETKISNFGICKILLRKNLVHLKPLTSLSMEQWNKLNNYSASVKWS